MNDDALLPGRGARIRLAALLVTLLGSLVQIGCAARGTKPPIIVAAGPARALQNGDQLRVATANLWGVAALGFDWADEIDARFAAMADRLARNAPRLDIVLIQEAWKNDARHALLQHEGVVRNFPFRVDAVDRPGGAGLVILSRFPIEEARFHRFHAQGNCLKFWEADCLSGKGILAVRLRIGARSLWVGDTHLIACYPGPDAGEEACDEADPNGATRMAQLIEARGFIEDLAAGGPLLLGGDFNFTRTSRYYAAMVRPASPTPPDRSPTGDSRRGWSEAGQGETRAGRIDYLWTMAGNEEAWHVVAPPSPIFTAPVRLGSSPGPVGTDDPNASTGRNRSVRLSDHPVIMATFCLGRREAPANDCLSLSNR